MQNMQLASCKRLGNRTSCKSKVFLIDQYRPISSPWSLPGWSVTGSLAPESDRHMSLLLKTGNIPFHISSSPAEATEHNSLPS